MSFRDYSLKDVLVVGTRIMQAGLEGFEIVAAHGEPALAKSASLTFQTASWSAQNPVIAACAVVGTTGVTILAVPGLVTAPILWSLGFTMNGIQAGSAAATAHSWIGNTVAGSAMAIGQSAGAGGNGLVIWNGAAQLGGVAMTVGSAGLAWIKALS
ncbi:hypothetical protein PMG11_11046 [Penicillium brasilianum]|uniref:Uncharacterized protein n=1 Tax=Penicillium brasilianum TaxID=104259 RepID=A0A0F7U0W0_PENBI|nr:hypothetical protein PMG11_11046 [Penicillium brasilianum]